MEEIVIKEAQAQYFKSATNMIEGFLTLTNHRLVYSGTRARMKFNHGAVGNVIRDKMASAMGQGDDQEESIFDLPLSEVSHRFKRLGFSKRLVITDAQGTEYKLLLAVKKAERDTWPGAIDAAKAEAP